MTNIYPASLDHLYDMMHYVRENTAKTGFNEAERVKIELAVEEALVNIINYGYPNSEGHISLTCNVQKNECLTVVIEDKGISYNPLKNKKLFDPNSSLEMRGVGGYGIFFILKIMDEVKYDRKNDFNILTLIKYLE
jgi:serine/threonine-protein kinase RsbW